MMTRVFRGAFFGILLGIVGGLAVGGLMYEKQEAPENTTAVLTMSQKVIEESDETEYPVLRFHIRANSDREEDQALKMEVKEQVLSFLEPIMQEADSLEIAKKLISAKLPYIKSQVETYMVKAGFQYNADVYFTTEYFPLKQYGDVTFPAGNYEALRIDIGEVEGQNWWCVMYPSLCFVDASHAMLPTEEKEKLQDILTDREYDRLMEHTAKGGESKDIWFYHSKLLDTVKEWIK
ncbi:MAG: stage II sporulation protein R [Lachnospiraceae bacterium]|nr:stage II sporulation protein R [Lachnospiraceae bacterium]